MMRPAAKSESSTRIPTGRRGLIVAAALAVVAILGLYVLLPAVAGLEDTWRRLSEGDAAWLVAAAGLEILSFLCYVVAFRGVVGAGWPAMSWRRSYQITMAGVVATRLLATAGAGGIALTVWALDRFGMPRREIAVREATFLVLLYGIFMGALVAGGVMLQSDAAGAPAPFGLTVVPALFGAGVIVVALAVAAVSEDLDSAVARFDATSGRAARWMRGLATAPATISAGVRGALSLIRRRRPEPLGAIGWWAFDVGVLLSCLKAFGGDPAIAVVVMAYFVGMLANTLPVPGGIGAVDGGMIGALIGFGVEGGLAIVGVLTYRAFAFWLPMVPGVVAYVQLLREGPVASGAPASTHPHRA
jgi:putative heme transporter